MSEGGQAAGADLRGGIGWVVFGLAILAASWRMDRFEAMGATVYTAPGFVPAMFGAALVLLGAALAWRGAAARNVAAPAGAEPLFSRRIALMLVLTLAYAIGLVGRVPFWFATSLFVAVFTWAYADAAPTSRRLFTAAASGVLTTAAVLLVFERVFLVRLP
ncbi:MAG: tripartite tricarboxylate transporter TctB family protein [Burkholderiaceae bacterium]